MKKLLILMLLMPVVAFAQVREDGSFRTVLKGTVTGADGKKLYVTPHPPMDREIYDKDIIPIVDGKFEYILEGDHVQLYMLVFLDQFMSGSFSYLDFFPDAESVKFTIDNVDMIYHNLVEGGEINRSMKECREGGKRIFGEKYDALQAEEDALDKNDLYYNEEYKDVIRQIEAIQERDDEAWKELDPLFNKLNQLRDERTGFTPEATEVLTRMDALQKEMLKWQYEYMVSHPNLHSYSLLLSDISAYRYRAVKPDLADMERAYSVLSAAHAGHPYNQKAVDGLAALTALSPGAMFIDFAAPALDGTMHTLSEEIKGKIAVIDLWASWCGSCRRSGMEIIPIYEKYKDRGFTVVGVAREYKNTDDLVIALKRDGYPWLNLLELDDRAGIWMKYGANNAGGRKILVDENGKIVKLDVTAEEIAEYLSSRLD